jgi:tRNA U34 5-methylaminomethyl-2-thiouridine-forming methyltransferase MnmC
MWTKGILQKITSTMKLPSVFVTYCAKGQVKRDLKEIGLKVENPDGPPGKRSMLRAMRV